MSNQSTVSPPEVTERNYPAGWQNIQYRWTLACEVIRSHDLVRDLALAGRVLDTDHVRCVLANRDWDAHRAGHRPLPGRPRARG